MNDEQSRGYLDAHERLALRALEASDQHDYDLMAEIVGKADDVVLLLSFAIAYAEHRAQQECACATRVPTTGPEQG